MTDARFEMRYGWWRPLLSLVGAGPRWTKVAIEGDALIVRMGWAFRTSIPLGSIVRAEQGRERWWWGIGAHGWAGEWTVNGAMGPIVTVDVDPAARAWLLGFVPVRLRRLHVSVVDPEALVTALEARTSV